MRRPIMGRSILSGFAALAIMAALGAAASSASEGNQFPDSKAQASQSQASQSQASQSQARQSQDGQARRFIESFGEQVVALVQSPRLSDKVRRDKLHSLLSNSVDVEQMERFVLGEHWGHATSAQREEFRSLFTNYAFALFARSVMKHGVKGIAVVGEEELTSMQRLIHTRVQTSDGKPLQWSWKVQKSEDRFHVTDLVVDGVSLAKTYRSEVGSTISNLGMNALLRILWIRS